MIPYENTQTVKDILKRTDLNNQKKAAMIYMFDYDMACRSIDRGVPKASMTVEQIEKEIEKL